MEHVKHWLWKGEDLDQQSMSSNPDRLTIGYKYGFGIYKVLIRLNDIGREGYMVGGTRINYPRLAKNCIFSFKGIGNKTLTWLSEWARPWRERLKEASQVLNLLIIEASDIVFSRVCIWLSFHVLAGEIRLVSRIPIRFRTCSSLCSLKQFSRVCLDFLQWVHHKLSPLLSRFGSLFWSDLLLALRTIPFEAANADPKLVLEPGSNITAYRLSSPRTIEKTKWWKSPPSKNLDSDFIEFRVKTSKELKILIYLSFLKKGLSVSTWTKLYLVVEIYLLP